MDLEGLNVGASPWLIVGDFNCIRHDGELMGSQLRPIITMEEFNICINNCGLVDLKSFWGDMTLTNGQSGGHRKWVKLDWALVNS